MRRVEPSHAWVRTDRGPALLSGVVRPTVEEASFEIVLAHLDGSVRVTLRGEFDFAAQAQHAKALAEIVDLRSRVVVDLGEVDFIDSSGLAFLVKLARAHDGPLQLVNVPDRILRLLQVTGLDELFECTSPSS